MFRFRMYLKGEQRGFGDGLDVCFVRAESDVMTAWC